MLICESGVIREVSLTVVESAVLNDYFLTRLELHSVLSLEGNYVSRHIVRVVHAEATHALRLYGPLDILVDILVNEEE